MIQSIHAIYENGVLRPLSKLREVEEGQEVELMVQSLLERQPEQTARCHAELLQRMEAGGFLEHLQPPPEPRSTDWRPLLLEGEPLSETIIKMRREG
jgi:predicted DNA-binding antitoxin AbrB/MazE fold protein